ncbi:hypothetical protein HPB47_016329 [Ixodes persulcatus]|uniref:Uncharacterized protein n=1 Tax=Ixodes persulcatus TaxID=34615 RepID=A0AC60QTL2_IXOPE|nr:hypothetical protein HPB47_016329 [Ixodes persulcatus]
MEDQLLLMLPRLRVGLLEYDLAYQFGVHMSKALRQEAYPSTRVILNYTETFIKISSNFRVQSDTYSTYKCHNTVNGLPGITPNGFSSFVNNLAPVRISDKALNADSRLCNLLEPEGSQDTEENEQTCYADFESEITDSVTAEIDDDDEPPRALALGEVIQSPNAIAAIYGLVRKLVPLPFFPMPLILVTPSGNIRILQVFRAQITIAHWPVAPCTYI